MIIQLLKTLKWLVKPMTSEHECLHEGQIQGQSRKIERLEARSDFKEQRIEELNKKMDKLNDKFDEVIQGFNDLKMESKSDDAELELRLKTIETNHDALKELYEKDKQESQRQFTNRIAVYGVLFAVITILVNVYFASIK